MERPREVVDRSPRISSTRRLQKREQVSGFGERSNKSTSGTFFRSGRAERWREVLNQTQRLAILNAHAETMRRFGYRTVDEP